MPHLNHQRKYAKIGLGVVAGLFAWVGVEIFGAYAPFEVLAFLNDTPEKREAAHQTLLKALATPGADLICTGGTDTPTPVDLKPLRNGKVDDATRALFEKYLRAGWCRARFPASRPS